MKNKKLVLRLILLMLIVLVIGVGITLMVSLAQTQRLAMPVSTRIPLPEIVPPPVQGWEGVTLEKICLKADYSFPYIEEEITQTIDESAELILTRLGVLVVDDGSQCDATLTIFLTGQAIPATYAGAGTCYTGGTAIGEISLSSEGNTPLTFPISGSDPVSGWVGDSPCQPKNPADYWFGGVFDEALIDGLFQLWGPQALIWALEIDDSVRLKLREIGPEDEVLNALFHALEDEDWEPRDRAISLLGDFAPEAKEAIPFLLQILNDDQDGKRGYAARALGAFGLEAKDAVPTLIDAVRYNEVWSTLSPNSAAGALEQITGQDFGEDADLWEDWWEEQGN